MHAAVLTLEDAPFSADDRAYCALLIDAWVATLQGKPTATALLDRADSINIASTTSYWRQGQSDYRAFA